MSVEGPVGGASRVAALDVLRGLAVFGILVVNVEQMFLPWYYANDPVAVFRGEVGSTAAWFLTDAFFESKFITLFSLLFGAGFALHWSRVEGGVGALARYSRRLLLLFLFGALHAVAFYGADVLAVYALTALAMLPWRRSGPRALAVGGGVLALASLLWGIVIHGPDAPDHAQRQRQAAAQVEQVRERKAISLPDLEFPATSWIEPRASTGWILTNGTVRLPATDMPLPVPDDLALFVLSGEESPTQSAVQYAVYSTGPARLALFDRVYLWIRLVGIYLPVILGWRTLGLFLIGAAVVKAGLLVPGQKDVWRRVARIGLSLGLPVTLVASTLYLAARETQDNLVYLSQGLHDLSSLILAAGLAGAVLVWSAEGARTWTQRGLAAVGRCALTNYIGQSAVMSLLATSYGLGWFGALGRLQLLFLCLACFPVQIALSWGWLRTFRYGPLEWIWRCFTYGRRLPLRRSPAELVA